jgi:hypothetical protein
MLTVIHAQDDTVHAWAALTPIKEAGLSSQRASFIGVAISPASVAVNRTETSILQAD